MTQQPQHTFDYTDDYYFTVINNIEINIRAYDSATLHLWAYCHDNNQEMIDDELTSINEIQQVLQKNLDIKNINLPTLQQLLHLQKRQA